MATAANEEFRIGHVSAAELSLMADAKDVSGMNLAIEKHLGAQVDIHASFVFFLSEPEILGSDLAEFIFLQGIHTLNTKVHLLPRPNRRRPPFLGVTLYVVRKWLRLNTDAHGVRHIDGRGLSVIRDFDL